MAKISQRITNCLWFDSNAEEAATFYTSIFKNSHIGHISRYGKEGFEFHHKPEGSAMVVSFYLDGQEFLALNGGPLFKFNEAMSFVINCDSQEELDHFWNSLTEGGMEQPCGWLKDKFGVSWQVTSSDWKEMISDSDKTKVARAMNALFTMKKPDIAALRTAFNGTVK